MMNKKKILFLTNQYPSPDQPTNNLNLQEFVEGMRVFYDVDVFHFNRELYGKKVYLKKRNELKKTIQKNNYDIVHAYGGGLMSLFGAYYAKIYNIPFLLTLIGTDVMGFEEDKSMGFVRNLRVRFINWATKYSINNSKALMGVSNKINELAQKYYMHKNLNIPMAVQASGLNTSAYFYNTAILKESEFTVLFGASPHRVEKRYYLVEEAKTIVENKHQIKIKLNVLSGLNRQEVVEAYHKAHIMVLPSLYEGAPKVVKEALLCGCPVISTAVGDVPDYINLFKGCALVDGEAESIAKALVDFYNNEMDSINPTSLSQQASKLFSVDKMVESYHKLILKVV